MCLPCCQPKPEDHLSQVIEDNCCGCNLAAYGQLLADLLPHVQLVYITYHVDVGETPFLVAIDFQQRAIVVTIRGTLSLKVRSCIEF